MSKDNNNKIHFLIIFFILIGSILRIAGIYQYFWLDEVWSFLLIKEEAKNIIDIFSINISNNHYLNSLFIYLLKGNSPYFWYKYRLLSVICGIITIYLFFYLSFYIFKDKTISLLSILLGAFSFPLILYSSEARGYSSLILFSFLTLLLFLKYLEKKRKIYIILFFFISLLGFLSHPTYIYIILSLFFFKLFYILKEKREREYKNIFINIFKLFFIPFLIFIVLYNKFLFNIGKKVILKEQGNIDSLNIRIYDEPFSKFFSYLFGVPYPYYFPEIIGYFLIFLSLFLLSIFLLKECDFKKNIYIKYFEFFLFILTLLSIFHILLFKNIRNIFFRYIIFLYPFFIIFIALIFKKLLSLINLIKENKRLKKIYYIFFIILLITIVGGNLHRTYNFLKKGRGNYIEGLRYIYNHSDSDYIILSSSNDPITLILLKFYKNFLPPYKKYIYIKGNEITHKLQPKWFILYKTKKDIKPYIRINNRVYILKKHITTLQELVGLDWYIYKLVF